MVPSEVRDAVRDVVSRVVDASTADYPGVQMRRRLGIDGQVVTESRVVELLNQEYEEEHRRRTALEARVAALEMQVADTVRLRAVACAMYDTVLVASDTCMCDGCGKIWEGDVEVGGDYCCSCLADFCATCKATHLTWKPQGGVWYPVCAACDDDNTTTRVNPVPGLLYGRK